MKIFRQRKHWLALLAIMFVFAACKGDSPTAPPPGTGTPPGSTPPPTGVTVTVTTSNATPLVDSTSVITATVTDNGQPVPNGTAVEFETTLGLFTDAEAPATIRTTTNGVATVTLTSSTPGTATIRATVNNVSRTVGVTFRARPTEEPQPSTAPTITSVSPIVGRPAGGEVIRINGTNFKSPVRVLFNTGGATPKEAFVTSVSPTVIEVITPAVDLGAGQQLEATVTVITEAGTSAERSTVAPAPFTFRADVLTPRIVTASPNSGPINGGTRVTLFGDGFQAPVQVLFGSAESRVIDIKFNQIIVEAPQGRDTAPDGSGTVTGPIDITVVNINSNTRTSLPGGFRYVAKMQITAIRPSVGSGLGGTDVTIDGIGFDDPVSVSVAGIPAQVIRVSGTQLLVRTGRLPIPCADVAGPVEVTNVENGDSASSLTSFGYIAIDPVILSISPTSVAPGGNVTVVVQTPGVGALGSATIRFKIGDRTVIPTPGQINDGAGTQSFTMVVPSSGFTFPTESCVTTSSEPGLRFGPVEADVTFLNVTTGCIDTVEAGLLVLPPSPNPCLKDPTPIVTNPAAGCATPASATVGNSTTATITIANDLEARPLNILTAAVGGANASDFTIAPTSASNITQGTSRSFTVTFTPSAAGVRNGLVTFTTNSSAQPTVTVCVRGTGIAPPP